MTLAKLPRCRLAKFPSVAAMKGFILLAFVVTFQADISADGKVIHGDLWTGDNWHFLARFCFLSLHGKFDYEVQVGSWFA